MDKSVYEIIKEAVEPEGVLPENFDLSCEAKRDTAFIMGAADGLWIRYGQPAEESSPGFRLLKSAVEQASKGNKNGAAAKIEKFAEKYSMIEYVDLLPKYIFENKFRLNSDNLRDFAYFLVTESTKAEAVKAGMNIFELLDTNSMTDVREIVRILALCSEFSLFAAYIMLTWDNRGEEMFKAVKKARDRGKVNIVRFMEPDMPETKEALKLCESELDELLGIEPEQIFNI